MFNICLFLLLDCDLDVPPLLHPLCPFHCHSYQFLVSFLPFPPLCVTVEFPPSWLPPPPSPPSFVSLSPPPSLSLFSPPSPSVCQQLYLPTQTLQVCLWGVLSFLHPFFHCGSLWFVGYTSSLVLYCHHLFLKNFLFCRG